MRAILGWTGRILLWTVILGCCAVLAIAVLLPRVAGATPYAIMTGSMQPTLPAGTLAVVKPADPDTIGVGTVITYQLESGRPTVVTHRVVAQGVNHQGELLFRTQGDANDTPDQRWVRPVQIRGKLWYAIPYLGYPTQLITGRQHQLLVYVAAAGLLGYAGYMFGAALRDRRRTRRQRADRAPHGARSTA